MTRTNVWSLVVLSLLVCAATTGAYPRPAGAQARTAEIRTWDGQTYLITDPAVDVFYTIAPPPKEGNALPDAEKRQGSASNRPGLMLSLDAVKSLADKSPDVALQHHRPVDAVTIVRNQVEVRVPLDRLTSLTFFRHPVRSTLPPWFAADHRRYTAVAVLADGSRIEGDVNLGWTWVRGATPQGRVDLPWDRIEVLRFR